MVILTNILSVESWILILSVVVLVKYYFYRRWNVLKEWNIPHDPPTFLNLGHARNYLFSNNYFKYELECKRKYGPVWGYYLIHRPRIVIHDPEILRQILIKEFSQFPNRIEPSLALDGQELASGLVFATDDQWKRVRRTLNPVFSNSKLREMARIVNWCVGNTMDALRRKVECGDGIFVARDLFSRLSLDVICSAAFSTDVNSQDEKKGEPLISRHAKGFFKQSYFNFAALLVLAFPALGPFLAGRGGRQEHIRYVNELCRRLIHQREETGQHKRVDLMHLMIDAKSSDVNLRTDQKGMTSLEIAGNAMTMLLAGYDTTSSAMVYLAYNLATHPDIQKRLQNEIDRAFEREEYPSFDDILGIKFLDMCVNETLRLYPPVQKTIRTAKREIGINGLTIPKGQRVTIPIYALSHDPEYWEDPMEYKPQRMENMADIDPMLFQPFGSGPRTCLGSKFALMEVKLAFCKILRHFTFVPTFETPLPPLQLKIGLTTSPQVDFKLQVKPRS